MTQELKTPKESKKFGIVHEFKLFINRGSVVDVAVAFVMGAAFKTIVDAVAGDGKDNQGVLGGLVGLTVMLPYLGFAISSALTTFVLLQTIERSRVLESVVLTLVSVSVIVYVFGHLLGMSLPRGPWGW